MVAAMRRRADPGLLLFLTPLLWGATFPAAKIALRYLPILTFMAWSRTLGFLAILAFVPLIKRSEPPGVPERRWREVLGPGALLGGLIFLGYVLQTEGLGRTSATNTGFITGLYVVFVPILAAVAFKHRIPRAVWLAVAASLVGLALLSIRDLQVIRLHDGDLLVFGGTLAWAAHITLVGHYAPRFPAWMLSLAQMGATAAFHLLAVIGTGLRIGDALAASVWPLLILTGILGTGVGFTLQVMAQRSVTTTRAVVLLAGESVFSAVFSFLWIGERLSPHQWVGAILVLAAMVSSELVARRPPELHLEPASAG